MREDVVQGQWQWQWVPNKLVSAFQPAAKQHSRSTSTSTSSRDPCSLQSLQSIDDDCITMAALLRRSTTSQALCQWQRAFSTSVPRTISLQIDKIDPETFKDNIPEYPYGPTRIYKQSAKGLYGGQRVRFGNNVSEKFKTKTRRRWDPNVQNKRLWSKALNRMIQVRVTTRVLRTIDKLGGLDEYLLGEKEARIRELGESGWFLRWAIIQTPKIQERFRKERKALGLPEDPEDLKALEEGIKPSEDGAAEPLEMEPVARDSAFQIEHDPDAPPIKFRVEPRKHVVLTADGWVRTRPPKDRWVNMAKDHIKESAFTAFKETRLQKVKDNLERQQKRAKIKPEYDELQSLIEDLTLTSPAKEIIALDKAADGELIDSRMKELEAEISKLQGTISSTSSDLFKEKDVVKQDEERIKKLESSIQRLSARVARYQATIKGLESLAAGSTHEQAVAEANDHVESYTATNSAQSAGYEDEKSNALTALREKQRDLCRGIGRPLEDDIVLGVDEQKLILKRARKAINEELEERVDQQYMFGKVRHDAALKVARARRKVNRKAAKQGDALDELAVE